MGLLLSKVSAISPFFGYAGSKSLTEKKLLRNVFAKGDVYFNTGDLMTEDQQGFISFLDRVGDTFRCVSLHPHGASEPASWKMTPSVLVPFQVEGRERGHHGGGRDSGTGGLHPGGERLRSRSPRYDQHTRGVHVCLKAQILVTRVQDRRAEPGWLP